MQWSHKDYAYGYDYPINFLITRKLIGHRLKFPLIRAMPKAIEEYMKGWRDQRNHVLLEP